MRDILVPGILSKALLALSNESCRKILRACIQAQSGLEVTELHGEAKLVWLICSKLPEAKRDKN